MDPNASRRRKIVSSAVAYARGDVNGDRIADNVFLTGNETPDSPFIQNITLIIEDGSNGLTTSIPLSQNVGYNPRLYLGNFTGEPGKDIMVTIDTGGSGGTIYTYIYSFLNNQVRLLFDFELYNTLFKYRVTYQDNYKVEVVSLRNDTYYNIDISGKGSDYLSEIYDTQGKLREPIEGFVDPLSGLYPVDFDSNGIMELLAYQKISGRYHADSLGYIQNTLEWKDHDFYLWNQYLAINGYQS
jgi:hypothetical protein